MLGGPSGRANEETAVPDETSGEHTHFWRAAELGGVELLHARYVEQRFAPHVHSTPWSSSSRARSASAIVAASTWPRWAAWC